ncbi:MAG TPA: phosphopyruvate hydratase [Candidatus Babeliales bacterium]|nr:phosphopyruvate hydratase [Candidatus Babeliales bacterium]
MKIIKLKGREIFDSRGVPTIECQLFLEDGSSFYSSVPEGLSRSRYEAFEMRDGGERLDGNGVRKAIEILENKISDAVIGLEPNVIELDQLMIGLDGTENKSKLGANAMLAASISILRAQAFLCQQEPYELIANLCGAETVTLPFPLFNMISGGAHADNKLRIQEFLILPVGTQSFREAIEHAISFHNVLKEIIIAEGEVPSTSDEGAFTPLVANDYEALDLIVQAIEEFEGEHLFKIALDCAASQFFNPKNHTYTIGRKKYTSNDLIEWYAGMVEEYPIYSLEDPLDQDDWSGWATLVEVLGEQTQIAGDDLFATDPARIWHGIENHAATAAIIKPNQIGTVTETLQAIQLCQEYGFNVIVSHRSGETNDTFIADLAVGTSAGQIKAGGCVRGERLAKYNRLLSIEDQLALSMLE